MTTQKIVQLARKHVDDNASHVSSARYCLAAAMQWENAGKLDSVRYWAIRSLKYSLGILSPVYQRAVSL